jgi:zinc protease
VVSTEKNLAQKNENENEKNFSKNHNGKLKLIKSEHGISIYHMVDDSAPLIHLKIAFKKSGSSYQKKSKIGVPQLYSSAVFCGSGKYSQAEFEQALSNISCYISCESDNDTLSFFMTAPKIVMDEATQLFKTIVSYPKFEEDKVKMLQIGMVGDLQNYANNQVMSAKDIFIPSIIFKSHTYENGEFGSSEDLAKLTIDDLKNYKKQYIVSSNAEVFIFGDISEEKAKITVDKIFSEIEKGTPANDNIPDVNPQILAVTRKYYAEGTQSTVVFAIKSKQLKSPRRFSAAVLSKIIGSPGFFKGRILSILRSKLGLIYGGHVEMVDLDHSGYLVGILKTDNSKVEKAIAEFRKIIKDLRENGISQAELDFAKKNITGTFLVGLRTSKDLCNFFSSRILKGCGVDALNDTLNGIHNVTLEDVKKLSKEILDEKNIPIVIIGGNSK